MLMRRPYWYCVPYFEMACYVICVLNDLVCRCMPVQATIPHFSLDLFAYVQQLIGWTFIFCCLVKAAWFALIKTIWRALYKAIWFALYKAIWFTLYKAIWFALYKAIWFALYKAIWFEITRTYGLLWPNTGSVLQSDRTHLHMHFVPIKAPI